MIRSAGTLREALQAAALLPRHAALPSELSYELACDGGVHDLLSAIVDVWAQADRGSKPTQLVERLLARREAGAQLSLGLPRSSSPDLLNRLLWWPRGIRTACRVALVSSRIGRQRPWHEPWFTSLRAACQAVDPNTQILLSVAGTTTGPYCARAAALWKLPVLQLELPSARETWARWGRRLRTEAMPNEQDHLDRTLLSPRLPGDATTSQQAASSAPLRDQVLLSAAETVYVLHLRRGGNLHCLLRELSGLAGTEIRVVDDEQLLPEDLRDELLQLGASLWRAETSGSGQTWASDVTAAVDPLRPVCSVSRPGHRRPPPPWPYLIHCTRAADRGWPDESRSHYLDRRLLGTATFASPLETLRRILEQRQLCGTSGGTRGDEPVVSFTAASLEQLPAMRVFRAHRGRWDFEPYGLCIDRRWLQQRGARAVVYGDERLWRQLSEAERPFFQCGCSRSRSGRALIDWTREREWRHVGDLDLSDLPSDSAIVFVRTAAEVAKLAGLTPWPVWPLDEFL